MDIGTTCPACGAQLAIAPGEKHIHCTYCGNEFDVNLEGVNPELSVANSSREMPDVPPPAAVEPPPFTMPEPAPQFTQPEFLPPPPAQSSGSPKPGFSIPGLPEKARKSIWVIVAVVVVAILCAIFACMALVYGASQIL